MMSSVRTGGRGREGERERERGRGAGGRNEEEKGEMEGGRKGTRVAIRLKIACIGTTTILEAYQHKSCFLGRGEESTVQRSLASSEISSREQSRR